VRFFFASLSHSHALSCYLPPSLDYRAVLEWELEDPGSQL
jgi:hypothetical protein